MRPRKDFLYFLADATDSGIFYQDDRGIINTTSTPTPLSKSPEGWLTAILKFARSSHYYGINRSFSIPLKFVDDGAAILRHLFYTKRGIDQLIQLVILKWDSTDDVYKLFYKGVLDLSNMEDDVAEGVTVNVMEGGIVQLLKAYEKTIFEIPCDGSIAENIKVNLDGLLLQDSLHYAITPVKNVGAGSILGMVFTSNDGDNIGIIKGSPSYEIISGNWWDWVPSSGNFLFSSQAAIEINVSGSITVQAGSHTDNIYAFYMETATSLSVPVDIYDDYLTHSTLLVPLKQIPTPFSGGPNQVYLYANETKTFTFNQNISLAALENFFISVGGAGSGGVNIISGNVSISFVSKYKATSCWGIRAYDLWQLLIQQVNKISSTAAQAFNYGADSQLLLEKLNYVYTSGDALRASGDPDYLKYFNTIQTNPSNSNYQFFNYFYSFGPCIKISISDFFDDLNPILNAALSNQKSTNQQESLFFERKDYVFDSSAVTYEIGEVSNLKLRPALDYYFTNLEIGYRGQTYDQKAGKYEYNTLAQLSAPIKGITNKKLSLISSARTDSYGIEYTRYNASQDQKSTTYNSSDNSRFLLNAQIETDNYDYDEAYFTANPAGTIGTPIGPNNANQYFYQNMLEQSLSLPNVNGTYLRPYTSSSIFVFNQLGATMDVPARFTYSGTIGGLPGDTLEVAMFVNGAKVVNKIYTITTTNITITGDYIEYTPPLLVNQFKRGDVIYIMAIASQTCNAVITIGELNINSGYFTANSASDNTIQPGTLGQLIELPGVAAATPITSPITYNPVSSSLSAFIFNENLFTSYKNFTGLLTFSGMIQGNPATDTFSIKMYLLNKNGITIQEIFVPATSSQSYFTAAPMFLTLTNFDFGDIIFFTANSTSGCYAQISNADFKLTSSNILVYDLTRVQYDAVSGIPSLLGNTADGKPVTTGPGAPFNIEEFTPARMREANSSLLAATLWNLTPDQLTFLTLEKNQYLSTTLSGDTITENANVPVADLGSPLFYAIEAEFDLPVKNTFAQTMSYAANAHIHGTYNGIDLYLFPDEITQNGPLNTKQTWKCLLSPKTNLNDLIDLNYSGLNTLTLMANEIFFSHLCPVKFVPLDATRDARYNFIHMDDDWFINRVQFWVFKNNYYQPWQQNDTIPLQCITGGATPFQVRLINTSGQTINTYAWTQVTTTAIKSPNLLWNLNIDLSAIDEGLYFLATVDGTGAPIITEGIWVKPLWSRSLLFQYSNTENKQDMVFSEGYAGNIRVEGWIDGYEPGSKFSVYEDQPADLQMLNGIPFRTHKLQISAASGVPDWMIEKISRIMLLNDVSIDGLAFTQDDNAKWEMKSADSWPKNWWTLQIREAKNRFGTTFDNTGIINNAINVIHNIDANAFGTQDGTANVIQITETD
jgi:hypothetical protein